MPRKILPRIHAVEAAEKPLTVRVRWASGSENVIDLSGIISAFKVYAPLRTNSGLFRQVHVGEHGVDIAWNDDIDMANDTLWRLAQEQSGATMTAEAFHEWRVRRAFTLDTAALALGLSRRTVAYYEQGKRPIPRTVALATRGLELTD
jgi:DNA-binding XRE family transcriptional regulator